EGTAYVLHWEQEQLPEFIDPNWPALELNTTNPPEPSGWETVFISGGRRDKISKGDIAGLFFKQGKLKKEELGIIELKPECAFVAVHYKKVNQVVNLLNNKHLKKRKLRVMVV
ncbi:MAG: DbpA RNA binding domain-containing protein, partial [Bacteroidota bacterium]